MTPVALFIIIIEFREIVMGFQINMYPFYHVQVVYIIYIFICTRYMYMY